MKRLTFYFRVTLVLLWLAIATIATSIWMIFHPNERENADRYWLDWWQKGIPKIVPVKFIVEGKEYIDAVRPVVYVSNHQHLLDALMIAQVYPLRTLVVAKKELKKIPLAGYIFDKAGNLFIDRSDREAAIAMLNDFAKRMREEGLNLWVLVEGHRNRGQQGLLPFKKGAFYTAIQLQVPIVPVVFGPSYQQLDIQSGNLNGGVVYIRVLEPIPTEGLTTNDVEPLLQTTYHRMLAAYQELEAKTYGGSAANIGSQKAQSGSRRAGAQVSSSRR